MSMRKYKVIRAYRASRKVFAVGDIVYQGRDMYGCASDDSRLLGIEHMAISPDESGEPFFTIPRADVELLSEAESRRDQLNGVA